MKSIIALVLLASSAAAQDFAASCSWYNLGSGDQAFTLYGGCGTYDGETRCSGLNLNNCLENNDGGLYPQADGNFQATCANPILGGTPASLFFANCLTDYGSVGDSGIDLNILITNIDGYLTCYGIQGVEC